MSVARQGRLDRFHRYGPWAIVAAALLAVVAYALVRKHDVNRFEVIYFCVLVPTIVLHEVSHGAVAYLCGDTTARDARRLTLNPLRHVDIFGTIVLPVILILTTGYAFGWAKPVPVSVNRLRHPRNQSVLVALAGPATNIVLAIVAGLLYRLLTAHALPDSNATLLEQVVYLFGYANVIIAVFNLIPVPPLDGSAVVERLLPESALASYYRLRPIGMILVLLIVFVEPNFLNSLFNRGLNVWAQVA